MTKKTSTLAFIAYKAFIFLVLCLVFQSTPLIATEAPNKHSEIILSSPTQLAAIKSKSGKDAYERIQDWLDLVSNNKHSSEWHNIHRVNSFFNQITFIDDQLHWKKEDYWATPIEFLTSNGGDCEDFSIAKYLTLIALGVPEDKLQLMQASTRPKKTEHMVVIYLESPTATPLVLDNIESKILPLNARRDLVPSYSFNTQGLWLQLGNGKSRKIKNTPGINHWEGVLTRFKEGQ